MLRSSALLASLAALAVACGGSSGAPQPDLSLRSDAAVGEYLVNKGGLTLYYFTLDLPGVDGHAAVSNCTGGCLDVWPVFHAPATPSLGAGLIAADFTEITRADGSKQTAYKGWPLYTFSADSKSGELKGENVDKQWFVLRDPFYTLVVQDKPSLHYLATASGKALYFFSNDTRGTATIAPVSACTSAACLSKWAVVSVTQPVVPTGVDASAFGVFTRTDGATQATFKGHPLYTFSGDLNPGDTKGHDFNAAWFTVDPTAQ